MQSVVIDKPYRFIPPYRGELWYKLFRFYWPHYLRKNWGIERIEYRGMDRLRSSLAAGHGILLAPNHSRPCDPMLMGTVGREVNRPFHAMASWHVFMEGGRFRRWLAHRLGAFSVHRWGMDREALKAAIQIIVEARRPLVLFPEGHITRTNDRLGTLLEGTAFIARSAARQRAKCTPPGHVVVHPVALKYFFEGDVARSVEPVLDDIEKRLSWQPQTRLPLQDRISKIGQALLCLKEIEYLGGTRTGSLESRLPALIDSILQPLEKEWVGGRREEAVVERAKVLRTAILPDLVSGEISEQERERRWRHLADVYLAQQIACYPADYLSAQATPERILETVERFEEDLTDTARIHRPLRAVIQIGEALAVGTDRDRSAGEDPIMVQIEEHLNRMLQEISSAK